jgi:hypothetical protein
MTRNFGVFASVLLTLGFVGYACTSGEVVDGPASGTGNTTGGQGTGNTTGQGGTQGTGNVIGQAGRGGTTGTGNVTGQAGRGGTTGTGNVTGQAGSTGVGNTTGQAGRGGTTGTGNTTGQAGSTGTGNTTGQAGVSGSAGSTGTCAPTFDVSSNGFVQAPGASGSCLQGYAFAGGDAGSSITPMSFATCGAACMLKMSGTVGAATMANAYAGVGYVGFNVGQDASSTTPATIVPKGSGLTVTFTASTGTLPLRLQLAADMTGAVFWCYTIATPSAGTVTVPYAMFNKTCWDNMGAFYAKEPIMSIQMSVPGGATATTGVSVAITGVKETP